MKISISFLTLLLAGILFVSCKKDSELKNKFDKSYKSWLDFKKSSGNSYSYRVDNGSWTGASSQTVITVKSGKIVQRSYTTSIIGLQTHKPVVVKEWGEEEADINTHQEGAPPVTLDEIYHKAETDWLKSRDHAKAYFETENQGMISACGYVEKGCQDDCFIGIHISYIQEI